MANKFTDEEQNLSKDDIFIKNSKYFKNDELIKYHLFKNEIFEYKCYGDKCPTKKGNWRRKPIYLILERKNSKKSDLRTVNLCLKCPNCYYQEKGPLLGLEAKKDIEKKCKYCNFILNNKFKTDVCLICREKISKMSISSNTTEYANFISTVYNDDDVDNTDYASFLTSPDFAMNNGQNNMSSIKTKQKSKLKLNFKNMDNTNETNRNNNMSNLNIDLNLKLDDNILNEIDELLK